MGRFSAIIRKNNYRLAHTLGRRNASFVAWDALGAMNACLLTPGADWEAIYSAGALGAVELSSGPMTREQESADHILSLGLLVLAHRVPVGDGEDLYWQRGCFRPEKCLRMEGCLFLRLTGADVSRVQSGAVRAV